MPIQPPNNPQTQAPTITANDIIANAMIEAGWLAQGEQPTPQDSAFTFSKLNRMLDQWAARKIMAYNVGFQLFTLTPNLQPHTIGPNNATFAAAVRPNRIEAAALVLNNVAPNVDVPMNVRDDAWWAGQQVKGITTSVPTDVYYSPDFPNGSLYLWPVPNFAYGLRLETWGILARFADLVTPYALPAGYEEAITMTLASRLGGPNVASLMLQSRDALATIQGNNAQSPRIQTVDHGTGARRRGFNYVTGQ